MKRPKNVKTDRKEKRKDRKKGKTRIKVAEGNKEWRGQKRKGVDNKRREKKGETKVSEKKGERKRGG